MSQNDKKYYSIGEVAKILNLIDNKIIGNDNNMNIELITSYPLHGL